LLLETISKHGWGKVIGYKKRVIHDTVIDRSEYQDLYLVMRERFKGEVSTWQESTDAQKHVFEDIGIATFLMLLWKHHYPLRVETLQICDDNQPWHSWPRPPQGFRDLGCGNGLLVHILISNGYDGLGIDVRERKSWSHYPAATRERLHVYSLDPTGYLDPEILPSGAFMIGNHADELTPWLPIISILTTSDFLSIPCCAWDLDRKFERRKVVSMSPEDKELEERLAVGSSVEGQKSAYAGYVLWLAQQAREYEFRVQSEALRIPSTRNWALIGWNQLSQLTEGQAGRAMDRVNALLDEVRKRAMFRTRIPEGKIKDH
jgi:tRNASer (uridine44-2'-O)-methyltransferase